jgi:hypothetical protein
MKPEDYDRWLDLRTEVWRGREAADIAQRYFRRRASQFQWWDGVLNTVSLLAQSGGVVALVAQHPASALALAVLSGAVTIVSATQHWPQRRADHLLAARSASRSYGQWNALWRDIKEPTSPSVLAKRIEEASQNDREILNSVTEARNEKLWVKMEDVVARSYDPKDLDPEQAPWVASVREGS